MPAPADYPVNLVLTVNGERPRFDVEHRSYRDPSYDRPQFVAAARSGMSGWAVAAIAFCALAAFTVLTLALTDNIVLNDAAGRRIDARIESDKSVRLANARLEPLRIKADLEKSIAQTVASVEIAKANVTGSDALQVVNRMIPGPVPEPRYRDGFANVAYMAPAPSALRTSFRELPSAREINRRVQHHITRRWAPCVAGYDQDPVSGTCSATTWHPGPMPID